MNILISAKWSGGDSAHFLFELFFWKKIYFLDPLDPFLDTSDDAKIHPKHPQHFLGKSFFRPPNLPGTCPKSVPKSI